MAYKFETAIYQQFQRAAEFGITETECDIPVISRSSNRITIGAPKEQFPTSPHKVTLRVHPSRAIRIALESVYGLACPDPLSFLDDENKSLYTNLAENDPNVSNYLGILILSKPVSYELLGADFNGEYSGIVGLDKPSRDMFVSQVSGLLLSRAMRMQTASNTT